MNKKDYLKQARQLDRLIQCNQQELMELGSLSTSIKTMDYSKIPVMESVSNGEANFAKIIEQMIELEEELLDSIKKSIEVKKEIGNRIESLQDVAERVILREKYLLGNTFEEISEKLNMSISSVKRIHNSGMKKFILEVEPF